uniref:Uncharacterized protein n=1 Tax=Rhizophora mucronata TaxID=61149 RepID=A0A2P2QSB8_RHIMU
MYENNIKKQIFFSIEISGLLVYCELFNFTNFPRVRCSPIYPSL